MMMTMITTNGEYGGCFIICVVFFFFFRDVFVMIYSRPPHLGLAIYPDCIYAISLQATAWWVVIWDMG